MEEITGTTSKPTGMSQNVLIAVGCGALLLLGLGWFLTRGVSNVALNANGIDIDRNVDGTVTYETAEGTVTTGTGASLPSNWPADVPKPLSGASIIYAGTTNPNTGAAGSAITYTVQASPEVAIKHYAEGLGAQGWKVENTAQMQGMNILSATKDTRTVGVYVVDSGEGAVQVTVGVEL